MDDGLQCQIGLRAHVLGQIFVVPRRAHKGIAGQGGELAEKDDGVIIAVDHVMAVVGIAGDKFTDKAGAVLAALHVGIQIKRQPHG